MLPRRESSRARYQEYRARRRNDLKTVRKPDEPEKPARKRSRSFFALFAHFWSLTRRHRAAIYLALTTLTIMTLVGLVIPASTKVAIDYILTDNPGPAGIPIELRERFNLPTDRVALMWLLGRPTCGASHLTTPGRSRCTASTTTRAGACPACCARMRAWRANCSSP